MLRLPMLADFRTHLRARLKEAGTNQTAFAAKLGVAPSTISRMLLGQVALPLDEAGAWADALGLRGPEREEFLDAMALAASPARVQAAVRQMRAELYRLRDVEERCQRRMSRAKAALERF